MNSLLYVSLKYPPSGCGSICNACAISCIADERFISGEYSKSCFISVQVPGKNVISLLLMFTTGYDGPVWILITAGSLLSVVMRKLTLAGALTGWSIAGIIYMTSGLSSLSALAAFFITGVAATRWQREQKMKRIPGISETGRRDAKQVWANGGVAAVAALLSWWNPEYKPLYVVMCFSALAAATADTWSSELGMVYGKHCYNMLNFRKGKCGEDGMISAEGSAFGVAGSLLISMIYVTGWSWDINWVIILFAGTVGNIADSLLGAILERKGYIGNNMVNLLNTVAAALAAALIFISVNHTG